ncbi:MAG: DNA adenine methylase, partial [Epsilonproteobacteria bacterium]|nr:DNA adenine methylase [Campylobacterota bacterium]
MEKIIDNNLFSISQRRYLGNKSNLLEFIVEIVNSEIGKFNSFCDIFAGTGVVGSYFNREDRKIVSNDLLYHNFVALKAFLDDNRFDKEKISNIIDSFNNINIQEDNYFSIHFGDRYFSKNTAQKIGYIRENIENLYIESKINLKEKYILLTSLNYSIDKIANTVGHYDAYIKKDIKDREFKLKLLDIDTKKNRNNEIYNKDANSLIREIECDILYLDPPYNSRQYSDSYHLLENLTLWQKPEVFGEAKKFDRSKIKSEYCKVTATQAFDDLIKSANCKYILLSYNNMANKGNHRSNARIQDKDIIEILSKRGEVKIFEKRYREFN